MGDNVKRGISDKPSSEDHLGIKNYMVGVARFIEETNTPLSISIQGDWGSGKTSLLRGIESNFSNNVKVIWFNAWEESQFNMGNQLGLSFFKKLIFRIGNKDENITKKFVDILKLGAIGATNIATNVLLGGKIVDDKTANEIIKGEENRDFETLKNELKQIIYKELGIKKKEETGENKEEVYENKDNKRLVVFIDDLDRLEPIKAVELMEIIKNFLDIEYCVFVYAIDFSIVQMGVKAKFAGLDADKGRKFFEKIIQVPFKMPIDKYDVKKYVEEKLVNSDVKKYINDKNVDKIIDILKQSVGYNPRAILRVFNQMNLYTCINKDKYSNEDKQLMLLSVLCMQSEYENLYDKLMDLIANDENVAQILIDFKNNDVSVESRFDDLNSNEKEKSLQYLRLILNSIEDNNINDFVNILNDSQATRVEKEKKKDDPQKEHYEKVKNCVIREIERYKENNEFHSIGTSKSKNIFTTKEINNMFVNDKFKNDSTDFGNLCGYCIGIYGLTKNSWNTLSLSIGVKDYETKGDVKNNLEKLINAKNMLLNDDEVKNIIKESENDGLTITINNDDTIGKMSKNIFTIRFNVETEDENAIISNIDKAFDFALDFEKRLISKIGK